MFEHTLLKKSEKLIIIINYSLNFHLNYTIMSNIFYSILSYSSIFLYVLIFYSSKKLGDYWIFPIVPNSFQHNFFL